MKSQKREQYEKLKSLAEVYAQGGLASDRRVQLKMPAFLVELLDKEFPDTNRSQLLTQAVLEMLIRKMRQQDPELEGWISQEQLQLDQMWAYLHEREKDS